MSNVGRVAVIAGALLLGGCGGTAPTPPPTGTVAPAASAAAWLVLPTAGPSMDPSLATALTAAPAPPGSATERVDLARQSGDAAYIVATPTDSGFAGEGDVVVALRDASGWHVVSRADTAAFCAALAKVPNDIISDAERAFFGECR